MKWVLVAIIVLTAVACSQTDNPTGLVIQEEKIKIGVSAPYTEFAAVTGKWVNRGIELALERLSEEERNKIELIYEDDKCNPTEGITVAQKLLDFNELDFILGPFCATVVSATMDYYEQNNAIYLITGLGIDNYVNQGKYGFVLLGEVKELMKSLAKHSYSQGDKHIGIIYLDDDYGRENAKYFEQYFTDLGGAITTQENFPAGEKDFRTQLTKIKATQPDAIMIIALGPPIVNMLKQLEEIGFKGNKYGIRNAEDTEVITAAGELIEGIIFPSTFDPVDTQVEQWFAQRYLEKYNEPHEAVAANAFDSFNILLDAINACGQEVECVRGYILNVKDYQGASGTFSVNEKGTATRNIKIRTVVDGKLMFLE
ncbi:hypothetical protein COV18_06555 [Candidatus Woesearchaeota archaeon CG10_big_fil_rev_8_21_14_0_10_37_12]|nr:MAG: hypothetical protein COV18_06555 [Candidatus Woesearchaeota archaeon CG10_big_fil_rev_8_21_14_0_10_37_12]